jgi:hypothetical protein
MENNIDCKQLAEIKAHINLLVAQLSPHAQEFYGKENQAAGLRLRKILKTFRSYIKETSDGTLPKTPKKVKSKTHDNTINK